MEEQPLVTFHSFICLVEKGRRTFTYLLSALRLDEPVIFFQHLL